MAEYDQSAAIQRLTLSLLQVMVSRDPTVADEMEQLLVDEVDAESDEAARLSTGSALVILRVLRAHARAQHDLFATERFEDGREKPTH